MQQNHNVDENTIHSWNTVESILVVGGQRSSVVAKFFLVRGEVFSISFQILLKIPRSIFNGSENGIILYI